VDNPQSLLVLQDREEILQEDHHSPCLQRADTVRRENEKVLDQSLVVADEVLERAVLAIVEAAEVVFHPKVSN
jgi:hypothetical protein